MTEATGKGNCMFANTITFKRLILLIPIGGFLCAPYLQAQQQSGVSNDADLAAESQAVDDNRHIDRLGEVSVDEWELDLALPSAAPAAAPVDNNFSLPDAQQDQALQQLLSKLAVNAGNTKTLSQLNALLSDVLQQANDLMVPGSFDQAAQMLSLIQSINPDFHGLEAANSRIKVLAEANDLLMSGNSAFLAQKLTSPDRNNALYYFNLALSKNPENESAKQGVGKIQEALIQNAMETARELDFDLAEVWLQEASTIQDNQELVEHARIELAAIQQQRAVELEQKVIAALNAGKYSLADFNIIDLIALGGQEIRVQELRSRLKEARVYAGYEPGQLITDDFLRSGNKAPTIIVIAAGSFLMGTDGRTGGAYDNEHPRHRVTFEQGFGLGVREVTVGEFRLFIEATGYRTAAERKGQSSVYHEATGRLNPREGITWEHTYHGKKAKAEMPVLHVNIYDAQAYLEWLADQTGKRYRLPSEAEYEFVARAGGRGTYWWGEGSPPEVVENLTGERDSSPGKRQWSTFFKKYGDGHWGPAPAGAVGDGNMAHPMGVRDITGNVSEWTEDCWHQNYMKAPANGSAWVNPGCHRRVVRGGYWASAPAKSRAAFRISAKPETYGPVVGFRVARDL